MIQTGAAQTDSSRRLPFRPVYDEPAWLVKARRKAWDAHQGTPLPRRVGHLWRYTPAGRFALPDEEALASPAPSPKSTDWPGGIRKSLDAGQLSGATLCREGQFVRSVLAPALAKSGIVLGDLREAASRHGDIVRAHLGKLVGAGRGKFEALNGAVWGGGVFLYVPSGAALEMPVHLLHAAGKQKRKSFFASRLLVVAGDGSDVTLVDEYAAGRKEGYVNAGVEIFAGASSRVRYVAVQHLGREARFYVTQRVRAARDADVLTAVVSLGAAVMKADIGTVLSGPGAESEMAGVLLGEGRQHFDHHTLHDHQAPNTRSNIDFKTVLTGRARSAYTGLIRIADEARGSEAYQENRNLLLSEGARAESIPELEILTEDVRCTHGATVSSLDPEQISYGLSRGIPRPEAARIIVGGFVEPTLRRVPENIRKELRGHVRERLG
jgi:Fe-S cluster assembly protein SufD